MRKYIATLGAAIMTALSFTSCLSSNSDNEQTYTSRVVSSETFNRVEDAETGEVCVTNGATYQFAYNFTKATIVTEISGLSLTPGSSGLSFRTPALELKIDGQKGFYYCSGTDIVPQGDQAAYVFTTYSFRSIPGRTYDNHLAPVYCLNYTLNNRYHVTVIQVDNFYFGTTTSTADDGKTFTTVEPACHIQLNKDKMTATLAYNNLKLSNASLSKSFYVKDLPFTTTSTGYIIQHSEPVNPYDGANAKIENVEISNINVSANIATGANVTFRYKGEDSKTYDISAPLEYYVYQPQNNTNK